MQAKRRACFPTEVENSTLQPAGWHNPTRAPRQGAAVAAPRSGSNDQRGSPPRV